MANLKFYKCDVTAVTYTATGSDASYPLTNLNSFFVGDYWKGANANNNQQLALSYALSGKTFIIVGGSNIAGIVADGGNVVLQRAADSAFTSNLETIKTWATGNDTFTELTTFEASNRQYWRLYYNNTASAVPIVGNFYVGIELDLGDWHAYPYLGGKKLYDSVSEMKALDGRIRTSRTYTGGRRMWSLPIKNTTSAVASTFSTFFGTVGGRGMPFYFTDANSNLYLVMFDMDDDPFVAINAGDISEGEILMKGIEI